MNHAVLGFLLDDNKVLLAMKKRGFGVGKYNGFGGKLEPNETPEQALAREAQEELNIKILENEKVAELNFYNNNVLDFFVEVFLVRKWLGMPEESEELKPKWFEISKIPFGEMWEDDRYWLKHVLTGKKLIGYFWFEDLFGPNPRLLKHEIIFIK